MKSCILRASRFLLFAGVLAGVWAVPYLAAAAPQARAAGAPAAQRTLQERLSTVQADLFGRVEHLEEDIAELKEILAIDPQSAEAHMLLGLAYRALGAPQLAGEAKAELRQALDLNPNLVAARYVLAQVYLDMGRFDSARDEMQTALTQAPGQPQFLAVLGEAERQMGNPQRSVELNEQALKASPSFAEATYYLARAQLDLGQRDAAIKNLEQVARAGAPVADVYISLGGAYLDANRPDDAIAALEQGVRAAPARAALHIELARAYRVKGLLAKADQELVRARPSGDAVQATAEYQQVETGYNIELGRVRLAQTRLTAAAAAFQKAVQMTPDSGPAHLGLAEVFLRQRQFARAKEEAEKAEALGHPLPDAERKTLDAGLNRPAAGGGK
jgi:tetratricopeptide (TPR) repeat protein